jgi:hypothetical protein
MGKNPAACPSAALEGDLILKHNSTTHTMKFQRNLALLALPLLLIACASESGGSDAADSAATTTTETEAQPEAAADNKMDLAKDGADAPTAPEPAGPTTSITFAENAWDFGTIDEGDAVTHVFKFTNTGDNPLIIDRCKGSCGCTVPQCPKEPVAPGEEGEIEVKFNSKGKKNKQTKTVTINANTVPEQTRITISANVTPAPAADAGK